MLFKVNVRVNDSVVNPNENNISRSTSRFEQRKVQGEDKHKMKF